MLHFITLVSSSKEAESGGHGPRGCLADRQGLSRYAFSYYSTRSVLLREAGFILSKDECFSISMFENQS